MRDGRVWTMQEPFGAFTWYPVNDQPSDKAFYDARISVPRPWVGVFNGQLLSRRSTAHRTVTRFRLDSPAASYLTTIAIGPYERVSVRGPHGLPVTGWVDPGNRAQRWLVRETPALIEWLESKLGRYPFDRAGVVFVPSQSAMETQTLVTMGTRFPGGRDHQRETMLHELAHQWYGDTVTPRDWRDMWLNEGFAMYIQFQYAAEHGGLPMKFIADWLRLEDQRMRNRYGPPGAYHRHDFGSGNVYYCPALMLIELRAKIGAAEFARVLRAWPQQHRSSNQSRAGYIAWLNEQTGRDLTAFVRTWLMSPTTPR
jgi:aminopeptidase N